MPQKLSKIKIKKNYKCYEDLQQSPYRPKISFLGLKLWTESCKHTDGEVITEDHFDYLFFLLWVSGLINWTKHAKSNICK